MSFYRATENYKHSYVCVCEYMGTHIPTHTEEKKYQVYSSNVILRGRIMGVLIFSSLCLLILPKFSVMSTYCLWAFSNVNKSRSNSIMNPLKLIAQLQQLTFLPFFIYYFLNRKKPIINNIFIFS